MVTIDARRRIDRPREASKPASQTGRQAARSLARRSYSFVTDFRRFDYTALSWNTTSDQYCILLLNRSGTVTVLFYTLKFQIANVFVVLMPDKFSGLRSN